MLTKEQIENKGFILNNQFTLYNISGNIEENIDLYIALALIEKEGKDDKEFPIQMEYNNNKGLFKVKTFYNNPKMFNEYFHIGIIETQDGLDNLINNEFNWKVKEIDLDKLEDYE